MRTCVRRGPEDPGPTQGDRARTGPKRTGEGRDASNNFSLKSTSGGGTYGRTYVRTYGRAYVRTYAHVLGKPWVPGFNRAGAERPGASQPRGVRKIQAQPGEMERPSRNLT